MVAAAHPLFGRLLPAVGFRRVDGIVFLVVRLPDASPGTIRADATDVVAASGEQQTGIHQVNEAVVLMDEVTQRNAALVEEAAAAAGSLEESTQQMIQAISVFNLDGMAATAVALPTQENKRVALPRAA